MSKTTKLVLPLMLSLFAMPTMAGGDFIKVMTQNQYLGADLTPIVAAPDEVSFNAAVITALQQIAANDLEARIEKLAFAISSRRPHVVGLQEVYEFTCEDFGSGNCAVFEGAFNDHLEATMQALEKQRANYKVAAVVENLVLPPPALPLPGLPVHLDADGVPDMFVGVIDRDVILTRHDVSASAVNFGCQRPSADGCNFTQVASVNTLIGPINIERGFVGVDATVRGKEYRVINTHLEVRTPDPTNPLSSGLQAAQATELLLTAGLVPRPADSRLIILGDINSAPEDVAQPFVPPYQQFATGIGITGDPVSAPYIDAWTLNRWARPGATCCQDADLSNPESALNTRIDSIWLQERPRWAQSNTLGTLQWNKTESGLWPSDHATVISRLFY